MTRGRVTLAALLLVVALAPSVPARAAGTIYESYRVPTPDGVLYGEVVRPRTDVPVPVVLTISPYNHLREPHQAERGPGEQLVPAPDGVAEHVVPRGYARAVFDVVGTHSSGGCFDYGGPVEQRTNAAVVEHLAAQPWSNGNVGMIGLSYDGETALSTAVAAPPSLKAIVVQASSTRLYDFIYANGIRTHSLEPLGDTVPFGLGATEPDGWLGSARLCDELRHASASSRFDPVFGGFWAQRDHRAHARRIRAAVMIEQGWLDETVRPTQSTQLFNALPPTVPRYLEAGQFAHTSSRLEGALARRLAWFDTFLKGVDRGTSTWPAVRSESSDGTLREAPAWPPPGAREVVLPLSVAGTSSSSWFDDRTLNDTTMLAGEIVGRGLPSSLRLLVPSLGEDVRVISSTVDLVVSSTVPETHLIAYLFVPTWSSPPVPLSRGALNVRNRNGLHVSQPVEPGVPYAARVHLHDTDHVVRAGEQLLLFLASTNQYQLVSDQAPPSINTVDLERSALRLLVVDV